MAPVLRYGSEVWWLGKNPTRDLETVKLGACKSIMRVSESTSSAFVRGELATVELERERHISILAYYGKLCDMEDGRWPKKLFGFKFGFDKYRGTRVKPWSEAVCTAVELYSLEKDMERKWRQQITQAQWMKIVKKRVEEVARQKWEDEMRMGKKLDIYRELKVQWGVEPYMMGSYLKGEVLKAKMRSGSLAIGEETARWMRGVDEERRKTHCSRGICKACDAGVTETLRHLLIDCECYTELRNGWKAYVAELAGKGSSSGWAVADPLILMLGGRVSGMERWQAVAVARVSSFFFVILWEKRNSIYYGPRDLINASGVKDLVNYGTES